MKNVFQRRKVCRKCQVVFLRRGPPIAWVKYSAVSQEENRLCFYRLQYVPARWISVRQGPGGDEPAPTHGRPRLFLGDTRGIIIHPAL